MKKFSTLVIFLLLALPSIMTAQTLSGTVTDADGPLIGATIAAAGTGTVTDIDGKYSLNIKPGTYAVTVSYTGYISQDQEWSFAADEKKTWDIVLAIDAISLGDVVVVGTRTAPRTNTTSALPVDVFKASDLISTGQATFDKALQYRVPSFNTVQTPVNDATSLLDPYEIRNMGPSRTLILINGKRKNMSALLYTQTSPGRGETGADISAIPTDMIKRVEILRDGASAQYGSDAIAGVMNVILKDGVDDGRITLRTGITAEGDGEMVGVSLNNGAELGKGGFIHYGIELQKTLVSNRPGTVSAEGEAATFGADIADVESFLGAYPDANNINGAPENASMKFAVNAGKKVSEAGTVYGNAAYIYKKVNSFANYRVPYWRTVEDFPYLADFFPDGPNGEYIGYVPTFEGDLIDYNGTIGFKNERNGWITDVSFTTGANEQTYIVNSSHNRNSTQVLNADGTTSNKYRENSPISFDVGGTRFSHNVGNVDVTKRFTDNFAFAVGGEFRTEDFTVIEGIESSYEDGGADSFAGNDPRNSGKFNRYNFGGYLDLAYDINDDFLINGTIRAENYSDFGGAFVYKLSSRYKLADDKVTIRGSFSTGFKAPTLHQIYTQKAQYSFVPGAGIQVGGLISNVSREARLLGLDQLDPENSTNITIGLGLRPTSQFSVTLDYYNITVEDRIILSSEINPTEAGDTALDVILNENNLVDLSFFANGLDSKTSGIDMVMSYRNIELGAGKLNTNLSGNYVIQNERDGKVKDPQLVSDAGQSIVNNTQEALFFTSRPEFKIILGLEYEMGKFIFSLNNTVFGPTTFFNDGLTEGMHTEFKTKIVTDLGITFNANEHITIGLNINNLLNVLPEWEFVADNAIGEATLNDAAAVKVISDAITFNQRYSQMTYDGYHFSQLGTLFAASLSYKF
ncbi:MAG: iron complex outermembrane receptor protein [Paraglaciecola sp.]|jgi:iron complex outermembrane receptor protein